MLLLFGWKHNPAQWRAVTDFTTSGFWMQSRHSPLIPRHCLRPHGVHVICSHCHGLLKETIGSPCPELLGDVANQSFCLQLQGWTRARKNWRCPDCTIRYCSGRSHVPAPHLRCRHGGLSGTAASSGMPASSPPPPPLPRLHADTSSLHCTSIACQGCLQVCLTCAAFCVAVMSPSFVDRLRELTIILNSLPTCCMPDFLLNPMMNESDIRVLATSLPRSMDHGNLSGSALMLVLLRPHLYMNNPVPLRLLGYPRPLQYLVEDMNPQSGRGPDNKRTNLIEALCAYWYQSHQATNSRTFHASFQTTVENALFSFQDAWRLMRVRVDIALRCSNMATINAHQILAPALQVEGDAVTW